MKHKGKMAQNYSKIQRNNCMQKMAKIQTKK